MDRKLKDWIMYQEVQRLLSQGSSQRQIATVLGLNRRTVKKYVGMTEAKFALLLDSKESKAKILDRYVTFARDRLLAAPAASAAQVHDWLKEHHADFPKVSAKTVYSFVMRTRQKYQNEVWVGDITYIPMTNGGFLYLSVWMDLYSRKIVGWDLQDNMRESLVIESLQKALNVRRLIRRLLLHSDRGGQYAGTDFRKKLTKHNILQSMSDADNPYDNAHMESFFSRFKAEMLEGGAFRTVEDARSEIFEYIEMYYNTKRLHSSIDYMSPADFENK